MATQAPSLDRLRTILKRQKEDRFGATYQPAIRAVVGEAPAVSRAHADLWYRCNREVHTLSEPERASVHLACYHPKLLELNEQRMLSPGPRRHPFAQHPAMAGAKLPKLRGTVKVAEDLGFLYLHPMLQYESQSDGKLLVVPYPYVGDVLLLLEDDAGPYSVDWNIKKDPDSFRRPLRALQTYRNPSKAQRDAEARYEIEHVYYSDGQIRTVDVPGTAIPPSLAANLRHLFLWRARPAIENADQRAEAIYEFAAALYHGTPPCVTVARLSDRYGGDPTPIRATLWHAIWDRELRVDLFRPIAVDKPLRHEERDVIDVYRTYFER